MTRRVAVRREVRSRHALAATSQPLATEAAVALLRAGGGAVDAAIAANAVLALVEPTGCGLGGDLFAIVSTDEGLAGLDASGRSPRALTREHLVGLGLDAIPSHGPLPVTVPGCVDGWLALHARFGRVPLADVLAPAIRHARAGFAVTPVIAEAWGRGAARLADAPGFADTFLVGGRAPAAGETFANPHLACTLERIANEGREVFYAGAIADAIDAFCRRVGCFLRREDLEANVPTWVAPVSATFRGHEVWELPPPGQGIAALQILNLLEPYDLEGMGWGSPDLIHHVVEAKKIAYEDRARFYADPAFAPAPVETLVSKAYADVRRRRLDPRRAATRIPHGDPVPAGGDTVCLVVADAGGTMVSLIQSNYRGFGSGLCPDGLGFGLQDRGELFALADDHPNRYEPRKRPFHTIIPAFVTRAGRPVLAFGLMGGDMQPQGHVQVLLNLLVFGMDLQEAGDALRVHHGGSSTPTGRRMVDGGVVSLEAGSDDGLARALGARGHRVVEGERALFGGYQAVGRDAEGGGWRGASESRKDGHAAGI